MHTVRRYPPKKFNFDFVAPKGVPQPYLKANDIPPQTPCIVET